jgi:hypothetical protein
MALGTEEATFNGTVDTFIAAWETFVDALDAAEEVRIVWMASKRGDNADSSTVGNADDATQLAKFDLGRQYYFSNSPDVTGDVPFEVGGKPLFFKITNAAGDLA